MACLKLLTSHRNAITLWSALAGSFGKEGPTEGSGKEDRLAARDDEIALTSVFYWILANQDMIGDIAFAG